MSDILLELSENPQARNVIKALGLPLPLPEKLRRTTAPYEERPFEGERHAVAATAALAPVIARTLCRSGAELFVAGSDDAVIGIMKAQGEAWGRAVEAIGAEVDESLRFDALVLDATAVADAAGLAALYDFFHPRMRKVAKNARIVVLARPPEDTNVPATAAARAGIEGFTRSLAKEIGANGTTANTIFVAEGAEDRLGPVLRFFLSARSTYVTAQPVRVTAAVAGGEAPITRTLENKVCLVTGAARGIGAATAELLAGEGAHVVILDRPEDDGPASKVAKAIGGSVLLADITDADAPEHIASALLERHGGVDVVVHNAGITRDKTLARMTPEQWNLAVEVNLGAVIRINDALLAKKALRDGGRVICLSSVSGIAGNRGQTNYSASKAGIVGYVHALAPKLAKRGITVNAIAPGFIETRLTEAMPVVIREAARRLSALGQGGQPTDVGQAITFLSTPGAVGITGSVLRVCGGALVGA
jgi:3-oxoacyl-[acyl-carrier protein] reductase